MATKPKSESVWPLRQRVLDRGKTAAEENLKRYNANLERIQKLHDRVMGESRKQD
jgi:hypothetical protein